MPAIGATPRGCSSMAEPIRSAGSVLVSIMLYVTLLWRTLAPAGRSHIPNRPPCRKDSHGHELLDSGVRHRGADHPVHHAAPGEAREADAQVLNFLVGRV